MMTFPAHAHAGRHQRGSCLIRAIAMVCLVAGCGEPNAEERTVTLTARPPGVTDIYHRKRESITFRAPSAYFWSASNVGEGWGEQGVNFALWSLSGDPVPRGSGTNCDSSEKIPFGQPHAGVCRNSPYHMRLLAGERVLEFSMRNGFRESPKLELHVVRNPDDFDDCYRVYDGESRLFILSLPPAMWDRLLNAEPPIPSPSFCRGRGAQNRTFPGFRQDNRSALRQPDGSYAPMFRPNTRAFHFVPDPTSTDGSLAFMVQDGAYNAVGPPNAPHTIGFMSVNYGSWAGRMTVDSRQRRHWVDDHAKIQEFLKRTVIHRTIE